MKRYIPFLILPILICVSCTSLVHSLETSTGVVKGIWNDDTVWATGLKPTQGDEVIVGKGCELHIDSMAVCRCLSLTLLEGASLIFDAGDDRTRTLIVGNGNGGVSLGKGSWIDMTGVASSSDTFVLTAGALSFGEETSFTVKAEGVDSIFNLDLKNITFGGNNSCDFTVEANAAARINLDCRIVDMQGSSDYWNNFNISLNAADSALLFSAQSVSVGVLASFTVDVNSADSRADITLPALSILASGDDYGDCSFTCDNLTSTMTISMGSSAGSIVNRGHLEIAGANPSANPKPDPQNTWRNCRLSGVFNNSFIQCYGRTDFSNIAITKVGTFSLADKYGICGFNLNGSDSQKQLNIYNCDISSSADTGIYLKACTRMNDWWSLSITSSIIRNCGWRGVWLDGTTKTTVKACRIYDNSGGNIGTGVQLTNASNENNIESNNIYGNKIYGMYVENSNKNFIYRNFIHDQKTGSGEEAIYLSNAQKNVITANECYNNPIHGIALESGSNYNYIAGNKIYNNSEAGLRVRYNANGNMFVMNTSTGNTKAGLASHSSIDNLCTEELYENNGIGDVYIEGENSLGYISQLWLKNCLLKSTTEFTNTLNKEEFTKSGSWVISQRHDRADGLTRVWGEFSMPQSAHAWHTQNALKWNFADQLYAGSAHGWNTTTNGYDTAMLRYDDGGVDGAGMPPSGSNDITSITTSSTTRSELWVVTYISDLNKWQVWGSSSGLQVSGGPNHDGMVTVDGLDYTSDNGEVTFRITKHGGAISPGEQYVFVTIASPRDQNTQKEVDFCDFSDPKYIGASFVNNNGATVEFTGTASSPTIVTRKLAEDAPDTSFYYGITLGGSINGIQYTTFTYLNASGLNLKSAPAVNTGHLNIWKLQPGGSYISASGVTHTFDNIVIETGTLNVTGFYNVTADNLSTLTFRDYVRPGLPDSLAAGSKVYWDPTLLWSGNSGFTADGVEPNDAIRLTERTFQVKYIDRGLQAGGNPPATVQLWIDLDDDPATPIEKYGMKWKPESGTNFTTGVTYTFGTKVDYVGDGSVYYMFFASNPYSVTVSTSDGSSSYNATGEAVLGSTLTIKGTAPGVTIVPVTGKQQGQVTILYNLFDYDNKQPPHNLCSISVQYKYGTGGWHAATKGGGGDDLTGLQASSSGWTHSFMWDSDADMPEQEASDVMIRITASDEDATGSPVESGTFYLDNVIIGKLVFMTQMQDIQRHSTSTVVTVYGLSPTEDLLDTDADGLTLSLLTTSTDYAFIDALTGAKITSVSMQDGIAQFRYMDNLRGTPTLTVSAGPGIAPAMQIWNINIGGTNQWTSTVTVQGAGSYTAGSTVTIVITFRDEENNPVKDKQVYLSASGSENIITQPFTLTNIDGEAYGYLSSVRAENKVITANDITDGVPLISSRTVTFTCAGVDAAVSTFTVLPGGSLIKGTTALVTIVLMDKYSNPVSGRHVQIGVLPVGGLGEISNPGAGVLTDAYGISVSSFTPDTLGTRVISITDDTDGIQLVSSYTVAVIFDGTPPIIVNTDPAQDDIITSAMTNVTVTLSDVGTSGVNIATSSVRLYGPDSDTLEVAGAQSSVGNVFTLDFASLSDNGVYTIYIVAVDNANNYSSTQTVTFTLSITGPEQERAFKESVYSFPNPARKVAPTIHSNLPFAGDVTIKIYNIMGELVYEESLPGQAMTRDWTRPWNAVNKDNLAVASGVYIVEVTLDNGATKYSERKKVIIIK